MEQLLNIQNLVILSLIGALIANAKAVFGWLWKILSQKMFSVIDVPSNTNTYEQLLAWLNDHYAHRATNFTSVAENNWSAGTTGKICLGIGDFVFMHKRFPIWVSHTRTEYATYDLKILQTLKLRTVRSGKKLLLQILAEAKKYDEHSTGVKVYTRDYSNWKLCSATRQERDFDNVILPDIDTQRILVAIDRFVDKRQDYYRRGITHKLTFLFDGLPGTGKSSAAIAVATYLKYPIYNLTFAGATDEHVSSAIASLPSKTVLLIEDIDAQLKHVESENSGINLSTVLSVFDGISSADGIVTIITCNDRSKLPERLFRPGRVNVEVKFGEVTPEQRTRFVDLFGNGIDISHAKTTAEIQELYLAKGL